MKRGAYIAFGMMALLLSGCAASPRFTSNGYAEKSASYEGVASYYGDEFHGRPTSSGEVFDKEQFTAAHRSLPFNTVVNVTNLVNGKSVTVRINDRGPFKKDRAIDLSLAAAREIGLIEAGTAPVRIEVISRGSK